MRQRLQLVWWDRLHRRDATTWSKYRAKLEHQLTRALAELPALTHALARVHMRGELPEAKAMCDQLVLVTPEGLGLLWYTPRPRGGGAPKRRVYLPRAVWSDACAFLALVKEAWRLLDRSWRDLLREGRQEAARLARRLRLRRQCDQKSDHPHPPTLSLSQERERESTADETPHPEPAEKVEDPDELYRRAVAKASRGGWEAVAARMLGKLRDGM